MKKLLSLILIAASLFAFTSCFTGDGKTMEIFAPKIGKADAFIITSSDKCVLIDAGESDDGAEIEAALKSRGIKTVDLFIVTHFDKDHVGGAARILNSFDVKKTLTNNRSKNSDEYSAFLAAASQTDCSVITKTAKIAVGDMEFTIIPPGDEKYSNDDQNNASLVVRLEFYHKDYLFTGDILDERISEMLQSGEIIECDVLKYPHHGSAGETAESLIKTASPQTVIITCSDKNPPDSEVTQLLEAKGVKTYLTSNGDITIKQINGAISVN